ncbi:hypothetical protein ALP29_200583 [Pseudomonas syringae pv. avii]|uniref:Uncharacterized protein n=1 Tax=Pseudomonas syringae pv. avii TaxID=663959 RepID=A0A3M5V4L5_PSESX|nr:hypothetical protein ALP29_200583 [Pseudomonas syringae pv. avii]
MGVGDVFVTGDHVVQVDHVALGHGQQPAEQIDFGSTTRAPHIHPPPGTQRREGQGAEQQDGEKGV